MNKHPRSIIIIGFIACTALSQIQSEEIPHFTDELDPVLLAHRLIDVMDNREVLGQVLMFGYDGQAPDRNIMRWIKEFNLGGVKIFGWNAEDLTLLAETVSVYQEIALGSRFGIPLLIATDQEGGWVRHIKGWTSITPGNMALGADPVPGDSLDTGRLIARELAAVGVNMNFAPTVDVFSDPRAEVIAPRTFTADPYWTGILGLAFIKGQEEFGVISTAKHYPGHGDTSEDSHGTLPIVHADINTLRNRDLIPYRMIIQGGLPAIMAGHLAFPLIENERLPATLSKYFLTTLLREELSFDGVVITDDLFMHGARIENTPAHQICYLAMMAGADILLISHGNRNHREIINRFINEMSDNELFAKRVREAAYRVMKMKLQWLKGPNAVSYHPKPPQEMLSADGSYGFLLTQAARSITLVRNRRFPIKREDAGRVLVAGTYQDFFIEGKRRYPKAKTWLIDYAETKQGLQRNGRNLAQAAARYDTVIALVADTETAILLNELEKIANRVVVISVLSPTHLDTLDWAQTALAVYGTGRESFRAAFAALFGDF
ncbi:MAG: hypothetical protein B6D68_00295, partial [spirochete symbiont of Stewartia floridana]